MTIPINATTLAQELDDQTLQFPSELAPRVGVNVNQIAAMKRNGCRFFGRKTCLKWVREHLDRLTEVVHVPGPIVYRKH